MIAAEVAMVDLVVEMNLPLCTLDRINKVFKTGMGTDFEKKKQKLVR